ncbi:endo-1,6-alpha-mannosidase [Rhizopogon vinicolor AM-OR11-026]|uniref:Endo-1,6-alpha-mannosidase n=1 Tax=Rhizopogon vinicolor AM-OR11-026 TaxID=1314800 RepID=A0A1B7NBR8_9AGAM|nr:endo-1,6-alpha-mannosidase [Rhizopogon vinicolor AM-OR11-026]
MLASSLVFLALAFCLTVAQNLSIPSTWRDPTTSLSLSERVSIAQNCIDTLTGVLNTSTGSFSGLGYWQDANVISAMANLDYFTFSRTNQQAVTDSLNATFSLYTDYDQYGCYNDDAMWWATAAYYGYRAYGDINLLSHAIETWQHVSNYVITASDASSGKQPNKDFLIEGSCEGETMVGGVFWRPTSDDTSVNSITTGLYVALSAYLASATGNITYNNAAILSANFIKTTNMNSGGLVLDSIDAQDCTRSPSDWLFTYNSGKYIEGLSVLASVTGNSSWTSLLVDIVAVATKATAWEGSNGIITEGADITEDNDGVGFKAVLMRGLAEAWSRNIGNTTLRTLIQSYIDVQFNALLDLASTSDSGSMWYSPAWEGPGPTSFIAWGQLAAVDVLVSAVRINS